MTPSRWRPDEEFCPTPRFNHALSDSSTIGGGSNNIIEGIFSVIAGGHDNRAAFEAATVGGGIQNVAGGLRAVVAGGWQNASTAVESSILGGSQNSAGAQGSSILGGSQNSIPTTALFSVAAGQGAMARLPYSSTQGKMFSVPGDGQVAHYVITVTTVGTNLSLMACPHVPVGGAMAFRALIVAKAFGDYSAAFEVKGLVRNYGGAVALVGTPTVEVLGRDNAALNITVETNPSFVFRAYGISGLNVRWVCHLRTSEVQF